MSEWSEMSVEDALEALIDYRGKSPTKSDTGIPVISAKVVKDGRIFEAIEQTIAIEYYSEWMRRGLPKVGDVVMTTEGPLGEVARLDARTATYALGQRIVTLRGRSGILDNGFLKYLLMSQPIQERLHGRATGSTVAGISQKSFREMMLPIAPITEQREIAAILGALDDKIELNRKTAAVLEEMARALYRSWFVDFDPVWAKAEGRPPAHMDATTAALFPDGFDDAGLPLGWCAGTLADLARLNPETYSKKVFPEHIEYVDLSNTKWGVIEATTRYEWAAAPSRARMILRLGDVIVGTVRPGNGSYSYVGRGGLTGSTGFAVLRPQKPENSALLYLAATDADTIEELANLADGGAYPAVRPEIVVGRSAVIAPSEIQHAFAEQTMPLIVRVEAFKAENQTLATLRDSLLPRLMSGELRVGAAREMLDEVA